MKWITDLTAAEARDLVACNVGKWREIVVIYVSDGKINYQDEKIIFCYVGVLTSSIEGKILFSSVLSVRWTDVVNN